jgi:hypothetical protein
MTWQHDLAPHRPEIWLTCREAVAAPRWWHLSAAASVLRQIFERCWPTASGETQYPEAQRHRQPVQTTFYNHMP